MKNEFLSIASHELRTPMTVIKWYGAILQSEKFWKLTEQQEKYVSRIWNNIDRLIDIVNDMLDLSRMESWKQNFDYKEFDIWKLLREDMKDYFWDICEKKNINLVIEAFALNVISDSEKIKQVLINLVWNAYKFTPEWWQIKIILTIVWSKKFQITVRDTWIWIPDNKLSNIFKKFYQVDNPLQKSEEWTWLGLPISKQIIESLWGNIKARNNKRWTWSSFFFVLDINGWKKNENRTSLEN
jgi:signal transduction histidine kinase